MPIGNKDAPFQGKIYGNGHVLSDLMIDSASNYTGLFGKIGGQALLQGINLQDACIEGENYGEVGLLVGYNDKGTINDCQATGMIVGANCYVGGLVGNNDGTITNCKANSYIKNIKRLSGLSGLSGCLVGVNNGFVIQCWASGKVIGNKQLGGLVGCNNGMINHCYATSDTAGEVCLGGLAGKNTQEGSIIDCSASGQVTGNGKIGSLVGENIGTVERGSAHTTLINSDQSHLVGDNQGKIVH